MRYYKQYIIFHHHPFIITPSSNRPPSNEPLLKQQLQYAVKRDRLDDSTVGIVDSVGCGVDINGVQQQQLQPLLSPPMMQQQ